MASVMIKCPTTGEAVRTGIGADPESFKTMQLDGNAVTCSACGETHVWNKSDAFLDS